MNPILDGVRGLPLHPLVVHGAVVLLPLSALVLILATLVPPLRRRLGVLVPLLALLAAALVPLSIASGEVLLGRIGPTPLVLEHERLARMLPPWAYAMALVALVQWVWTRPRRRADDPGRRAGAGVIGGAGDEARGVAGGAGGEAHRVADGAGGEARGLGGGAGGEADGASASRSRPSAGRRIVGLLLGAAAIVTASGTTVLVVLIGEAGARSVWGG